MKNIGWHSFTSLWKNFPLVDLVYQAIKWKAMISDAKYGDIAYSQIVRSMDEARLFAGAAERWEKAKIFGAAVGHIVGFAVAILVFLRVVAGWYRRQAKAWATRVARQVWSRWCSVLRAT